MVRNGEMNLSDVKRILRRYWWILPITTIFLGGIGVVASMVLPKRYTSETMVLVEQPSVSSEYVKPVITEDLNHRLAAMQEQILSRTRLQLIVEKFDLYAAERNKAHMDDLVERLRKTVTIKPMEVTPGAQRGQLPGFYIDVTSDNPQLAQQVCTEITSMFQAQDAVDRKTQAKVTTEFLNQQMEEAKKNLDQQDAKLAEFKRRNLGSLPEEEQTNLSILMGMNSQLEANTQALSRAQQDKAFNESLLSSQEATQKASVSGPSPETTEQQLLVLQDQLTTLQGRYTEEHPDVVKVKNQIEQLKRQQAAAAKNPVASTTSSQASSMDSPQIQQMRAKLRQSEQNINDLTKRQSQMQDQIRQLQGRVQASPVVEQQYKEITRDHQTAQDFYNGLLKNVQSAGMAGDLESQQQSEHFKVFDPPNLPEKPSFPNKTYFAGGGLGGGMVLGLGILYLLAASDKSLYNERDVENVLKLPVLTMVPMMDVAAHQAELASSRNEKKFAVAGRRA